MRNSIRIILIIICLSVHSYTQAQSFSYNTQHFGLHSTMLGGAVTAGNSDLSMAYYNPAALYLAKPQINISLWQPSLSSFGFEKVFDKQLSSRMVRPGLGRGMVSIKGKLGKLALTFLRINRNNWNNSIRVRNEVNTATITNEKYFEYNHQGSDVWYGGGSSLKLNNHLSIGLSQFISINNFKYSYDMLNASFPLGSTLSDNYYSETLERNQYNISMVSKLGIMLNYDKVDVGLVVKTPNYLRLYKSGNYVKLSTEIESGNYEASSITATDLTPKIKTPWEFNLGLSLLLKDKSKIWLNGSCAMKVPEYDMVHITNKQNEIILTSGSKDVFNISAGYTHHLGPMLDIMSSFRTNFFAYDNNPSTTNKERVFILDNSRFHATTGILIKNKRNQILLGIDIARQLQPIDENFQQFTEIQKLNTTFYEFRNNTYRFLITYDFLLNQLSRNPMKKNIKNW